MPGFVAPPTEIKIDLGGTFKFQGNVVELCKIHPESLSEEMENHPGTFGWLGAFAAEAKLREDYADRLLDTIKADISLSYREDYGKKNAKLTEEMLKTLVNQHDKVIEASDKLAMAKRDSDTMKNLFEAFKCRKDILVAMGYDLYSEQRNAEVSVKAPAGRKRT